MPKYTISLEQQNNSNHLLWTTLIQLEPEESLYDGLFDQNKLNRLMSVPVEVKVIELYKDRFGYKVEGSTSQENINKMWDILEE